MVTVALALWANSVATEQGYPATSPRSESAAAIAVLSASALSLVCATIRLVITNEMARAESIATIMPSETRVPEPTSATNRVFWRTVVQPTR